MTYVIGGIAGILFGCVVGYLKNLFIWKKYIRESNKDTAAAGAETTRVYGGAFISFTVNVVALAGVFFLRDMIPFSYIACLIGTAVALATMTKVMAVRLQRGENQK